MSGYVAEVAKNGFDVAMIGTFHGTIGPTDSIDTARQKSERKQKVDNL